MRKTGRRICFQVAHKYIVYRIYCVVVYKYILLYIFYINV